MLRCMSLELALFPRSLRCDDTVRLQGYFYRDSEVSGMPHHAE
jgi:hypothetical protein